MDRVNFMENNTSEELTEISDNLIKLEGEEFIKGDVK